MLFIPLSYIPPHPYFSVLSRLYVAVSAVAGVYLGYPRFLQCGKSPIFHRLLVIAGFWHCLRISYSSSTRLFNCLVIGFLVRPPHDPFQFSVAHLGPISSLGRITPHHLAVISSSSGWHHFSVVNIILNRLVSPLCLWESLAGQIAHIRKVFKTRRGPGAGHLIASWICYG